MATFTPREYQNWLKAKTERTSKSVQAGQESAVADIRAKAVELLSGTVSTLELARLGHPYARRHKTPLLTGTSQAGGNLSLNPLPINKQSERLLKSLRVFRHASGNSVYHQLQFTAPEAKTVLKRGGSRFMVDRGFWQALQAYAQPTIFQRLKSAIKSN